MIVVVRGEFQAGIGKCPWRFGAALDKKQLPHVKFRDVHRSVRAQRFDRSAGDAPSIGRVARVPGTGIPKGHSAQAQAQEQAAEEAMQGGQRRRNVILTWSAVIDGGGDGACWVFFCGPGCGRG